MINKYFFPLAIGMMLTNTAVFSQKTKIDSISWKTIATLPASDGEPSIGFAGPVNAVHDESLIVAGGANFPEKMPWEGGKKYYSDEVHILQKKSGKYIWNKKATAKLPEPIAYAGNTSTAMGVVYAGGENANGISSKAYLLKFNAAKDQLKIESLPDLPLALTNIALTNIENVVYAIGGDEAKVSSSCLFSLDLKNKDRQWKTLPDLPLALANSVALSQNGPDGVNIYVIGGRAKHPSGISDLHHTVYIYNPRTQSWRSGAPISDGAKTTNFSAGNGVAVAENFLLITGGDNGEVFHQIETSLSEIANAATAEEKALLTAKKNQLMTGHQGFYRGLLLYNTLTNSWIKIGDLPFPARVTTTATKWGENIILSNGEVKPGVRTPDVALGKIL
jgi:N-acetylneuraminate epimerase